MLHVVANVPACFSRLRAFIREARSPMRRLATVSLAIGVAAAIVTPVIAAETIVQISSDPFTNRDSQHRSEVEPDTFAFGATVVSAFQVGRYFNGGSSDIGWATSIDRGQHWVHGFLPGATDKATPPSKTYQRASDASVAFDARHNVWLVSFLGLITPNPADESTFKVDVLVSRSTNGGTTWGSPVIVNPSPGNSFLDKNWSVCDNTPTSPFYGHCYTEFDDNSRNDLMEMSTSTDGGLTWDTPRVTGDPTNGFSIPAGTTGAHGLGGQPLVQDDGRVVVPYLGFDDELNNALSNPTFTISSFVSVDGGNSYSARSLISEADFRVPNGNIRANIPLPSAEVDRLGKVYVSWPDCRFEPQCGADDMVLSTSTNGIAWSAVRRIPLDSVGSNVDHFLPGLAVDPNSTGASNGGTARLALLYYFYPNANCTIPTCQLEVGFASSRNGGTSWSPHETLGNPMKLTWLPNTSQGFMVGDYMSTSIPQGSIVAVPAFQLAFAPTGSTLNQPTFAVREDIAGGTLPGAEIATRADPAIASTRAAEGGVPHRLTVMPTLR